MLRLPTFVCYVLIGVGLGMCVAIQTITLHQIPIPDSSLFRYHMHEDENKPIMRGLLHTISAFLSLVTLAVSTLTNRHRHADHNIYVWTASWKPKSEPTPAQPGMRRRGGLRR